MVFIPAFGGEAAASASGPVINPGDLLITGSADSSARSWSFEVRTLLPSVKLRKIRNIKLTGTLQAMVRGKGGITCDLHFKTDSDYTESTLLKKLIGLELSVVFFQL